MQEVPTSCPHAALFALPPPRVLLHPLSAVMRVPGVLVETALFSSNPPPRARVVPARLLVDAARCQIYVVF